MTDKIVVLTTCDSEETALKLARHIVEQHLAACVSVIPGARSFYWWKEVVEDAREWMLIVKSSRPLFERLRAEIAKMHTYEVPEVIALPIVDGSPSYIEWMDRELTR